MPVRRLILENGQRKLRMEAIMLDLQNWQDRELENLPYSKQGTLQFRDFYGNVGAKRMIHKRSER